MCQKLTVLQHLKNEGSLSSMEAIFVHKIPRLSARIYELRKDGYDIKSLKKADNTGRSYVSYALA